jgi:hypothetical protein
VPDDFNVTSGTYGLNVFVSLSQDATLEINAINLAQDWVTEIQNANITASYLSTNWVLHGLAAEAAGSTSGQDLVFATPVPEPSSALPFLLALSAMALGQRRRAK